MSDFQRAYEWWAKNPVYLAGRTREIATLVRWLVESREPVIGVFGPLGIGKTTLAYQFMITEADHFPGGTAHVRASPLRTELPTSPSLVLLDDAESVPPDVMQTLLAKTYGSHAKQQLIVASREAIPGIHKSLTLDVLSRSAVLEIFHSLLLSAPPEEEDLLATLAGGQPYLAQLLAVMVRDNGLAEGLARLSGFAQSGVVDASGHPTEPRTPAGASLTADLVVASNEVIRMLDADPHLMHKLSPRQFEELVAELLSRQGYQVTLTPVSKDGGKDMYVAHKSGVGSALYVVECKRYAHDNPVGVGVVRQLYGIVQAEHLTGGLIATTSTFTSGAKHFQQSLRYQMSLSDYEQLRTWLRQALGPGGGTA
jgi:restriction system protein